MIKLFEEYNKIPKIGDWIYCKIYQDTISADERETLVSFFDNNIGKVIVASGYRPENPSSYVTIQYFPKTEKDIYAYKMFINITNTDDAQSVNMNENEIIFFSENKEDVEAYIQANKYNL